MRNVFMWVCPCGCVHVDVSIWHDHELGTISLFFLKILIDVSAPNIGSSLLFPFQFQTTACGRRSGNLMYQVMDGAVRRLKRPELRGKNFPGSREFVALTNTRQKLC